MSGALIGLDEVEKTFSVRHKAGWVRRRKAEVRAVDGVSFEVAPGSRVGYIGPNGACRMIQPVGAARRWVLRLRQVHTAVRTVPGWIAFLHFC